MTGKYADSKETGEREARDNRKRDRLERQNMVFQHLNERRKLQTQIKEYRSRQASMLLSLRDDRKAAAALKMHEKQVSRHRTRKRRRQ